MPVCFAPSYISRGLHTQATFLPPIEVAADFITSPRHFQVIACGTSIERPVGQRGFIAPGASSYFISPLCPRQLHCTLPTKPTRGAVNVSGTESVSRLRRHPLQGSLRWQRSTPVPHTPEASSPGTSPFRRYRSTSSPCSPLRAEQ